MSRPAWQRILGPLAPAAHLGIYQEDETLHAATVVPSILGPTSCDAVSLPLAGRSIADRVAEAVRLSRGTIGPIGGIVLGVPGRDVYLETRRLTPGSATTNQRGLETVTELAGPSGAPARPVVQLFRRSDPHSGQSLTCVVACRDSVLERLEAAFPAGESAAMNLEPAPLAALRYSLHHNHSLDFAAVALRVLVGPSFCAGYLLHGNVPLLCALAPAHEASERARHVANLIAGISHHARSYLELEPRDLSVEGLDAEQAEALGQQLDTRIRALPGAPIDGRAIATGLALGSCGVAPAAIHLHRQQKERRRSSRPRFPWRDATAGGIALVTIVFSMEVEAHRLQQSIALSRQLLPADPAQAARPLKDLEAERDGLVRFRAQWIEFDDRPLSWTHALTSLAQSLPDQVRLVRIEGHNPVIPRPAPDEEPEFAMNVISPEKHLTLGAILSDPYLKRAFPRVEVAMGVAGDAGGGIFYTLIATGQSPVPDSTQERTGAEVSPPPR